MEKSKLTENEKGVTDEEQSQEHSQHFLRYHGDFHKEFVLAGHTVNSAFCYGDYVKKCEDFALNFGDKNWLLLHDNASSHTSFFSP
jgi:hypothetical protein